MIGKYYGSDLFETFSVKEVQVPPPPPPPIPSYNYVNSLPTPNFNSPVPYSSSSIYSSVPLLPPSGGSILRSAPPPPSVSLPKNAPLKSAKYSSSSNNQIIVKKVPSNTSSNIPNKSSALKQSALKKEITKSSSELKSVSSSKISSKRQPSSISPRVPTPSSSLSSRAPPPPTNYNISSFSQPIYSSYLPLPLPKIEQTEEQKKNQQIREEMLKINRDYYHKNTKNKKVRNDFKTTLLFVGGDTLNSNQSKNYTFSISDSITSFRGKIY